MIIPSHFYIYAFAYLMKGFQPFAKTAFFKQKLFFSLNRFGNPGSLFLGTAIYAAFFARLGRRADVHTGTHIFRCGRSFAAALLCAGGLAFSVAWAGKVLNDALVTKPFRHHVWQDVLQHSVTTGGRTDFALLRAFPRRLNEYLSQLEAVSPDSDPSYFPTQEDRIAYWINAHNALALRLILDRYPVHAVNPAGMERPPCRQPGQACYQLGGKTYSLPEIRTRALAYRRRYPNIMFALTDFSMSAPAISTKAYDSRALKPQLTETAKVAMADPRLVRFANVNGVRATVALSPFFRRYERVLFASAVYREEDRAAIDGDDHIQPAGYSPREKTMKPYAPEVHAVWDAATTGKARLLPADLRLREVRSY